MSDNYDLAYVNLNELNEDTSAPASNDFLIRYDDSASLYKKVDASDLTASIGTTSTLAEINMLDDSANNVTIAYAASVTTDGLEATLTVVDAAGTAIDAVHQLEVFITDDDIGGVLTSTAASGTLTATTGAILTALTAKKHVSITTAATGIAVLLLVDSANTAGERFIVVNPLNNKVIVGPSSVAGDYEGG